MHSGRMGVCGERARGCSGRVAAAPAVRHGAGDGVDGPGGVRVAAVCVAAVCAAGGAATWRAAESHGAWAAAGCAVLTAWCAVLSLVDVRSLRLPNVLTVPGVCVIVAVSAVTGHGGAALAGAGMLTVFYLGAHVLQPEAMGAGDVKLASGLGAATALGGGAVWVEAALGALVLTAVCGAAARTVRVRDGPGRRVWPHGPSMCLASLAALALAPSSLVGFSSLVGP